MIVSVLLLLCHKYSVGRLILTKSVGSDVGEDVTWQYKNDEGTAEERLAVFNAVRGVDRAMKYYDVPDSAKEDVFMDLVELESVQYGQPYKARVILEVGTFFNFKAQAFLGRSG